MYFYYNKYLVNLTNVYFKKNLFKILSITTNYTKGALNKLAFCNINIFYRLVCVSFLDQMNVVKVDSNDSFK